MTVAELGSAFQQKTPKTTSDGFMESLVASVVAQVLNEVTVQRPPTVNVAAPNVKVDAPDVNVYPDIKIIERETEPVINITVPGLDELAEATIENNRLLAQVQASLQSVVVLLQKPVLKVVERGTGGLITEVRETRG